MVTDEDFSFITYLFAEFCTFISLSSRCNTIPQLNLQLSDFIRAGNTNSN